MAQRRGKVTREKIMEIATELINVPRIGPGRAKALLTRFGSVRGVQNATVEELQRAVGPRLGRHLWQHLHAGKASE